VGVLAAAVGPGREGDADGERGDETSREKRELEEEERRREEAGAHRNRRRKPSVSAGFGGVIRRRGE
jgi:hypothetical protein